MQNIRYLFKHATIFRPIRNKASGLIVLGFQIIKIVTTTDVPLILALTMLVLKVRISSKLIMKASNGIPHFAFTQHRQYLALEIVHRRATLPLAVWVQ